MKNKLLLVFLVALLLRLVLAFGAWHPDLNNHVDWGERFFSYGSLKFYAPESNVWNYTWPNQPPGTILIFAGVYQLFWFVFSLLLKINNAIPAFPSILIFYLSGILYQAFLKLPSITCDLGMAILIYKIVKAHVSVKKAQFAATLFLFNPVIWYNSAVWGQTDAIINFLFLLGIYLLTKNKLLFSVISIALCLFIKLSLVIFLPIYLIFLLKQKFAWSSIIVSFFAGISIIGILTLLFSYPLEPFSWLVRLYQEKVLVQQMHVITANAFNFWDALTGIYEQPNAFLFGPLTYEMWGNVLFALAYIPLLIILLRKTTEKTLYWVLALAAFSSFMLLTNMHERYLYPLFPYLMILVAFRPKLVWSYIAISAVNLLNLYHLWYTPRIEAIVQVMSFQDRLVPRLLGVAMTGLYIQLYFYIIKLWRNGSSVES
jgi:Gpi18-like mannosyltransferase